MKKLPLFLLLAICFQANATCFSQAAVRYDVDERLLRAIQFTENEPGNPTDISYNKDGSWDIGLMKINSSWLPKLQKMHITEKDLLDPCISVNVGAWILAENIVSYGRTWKAVGVYNSPTLVNQQKYINKVMKNYGRAYP